MSQIVLGPAMRNMQNDARQDKVRKLAKKSVENYFEWRLKGEILHQTIAMGAEFRSGMLNPHHQKCLELTKLLCRRMVDSNKAFYVLLCGTELNNEDRNHSAKR